VTQTMVKNSYTMATMRLWNINRPQACHSYIP